MTRIIISDPAQHAAHPLTIRAAKATRAFMRAHLRALRTGTRQARRNARNLCKQAFDAALLVPLRREAPPRRIAS